MTITDKQRNFIVKLLGEREITPELTAYVEANRPQSGGLLDRREASRLIDQLLACPKRRQATQPTFDADPIDAVAEVMPVVIPDGTYTVVFPDGERRTLQVAPATWANEDGLRQVAYLCGPDNELSYKGFAFIKADGQVVVWKRYRDESRLTRGLDVLRDSTRRHEAHEKFLDEAEAYALASGRCMRCHKTLTVPASLHRGLGPVCAGVEGVA